MAAWLADGSVGDPGRVHSDGLAVRVAVEEGRAAVAAMLGCRPRSVVFTSGGTEAIAAAVWGAVERAGGPPALILQAEGVGTPLAAVPLPATEAEVLAMVRKYRGQ